MASGGGDDGDDDNADELNDVLVLLFRNLFVCMMRCNCYVAVASVGCLRSPRSADRSWSGFLGSWRYWRHCVVHERRGYFRIWVSQAQVRNNLFVVVICNIDSGFNQTINGIDR